MGLICGDAFIPTDTGINVVLAVCIIVRKRVSQQFPATGAAVSELAICQLRQKAFIAVKMLALVVNATVPIQPKSLQGI